MTLTSFYFFVFFIIVLIVYYVLPKVLQWPFLLVASLIFYCIAGSPKMMVFLAGSIITVYLGAFRIGAIWKSEGESEDKRKIVFILVLLANIGILCISKYTNFIGENVFRVFSLDWTTLNIILPLGISFYTFQLLGYLIDVYRGAYEPEKNIAKFALFATFFPQIVSGPISRYNELSKHLYHYKRFNYREISFGLQRIMWGLFKKLVIAERLSVIVTTVFEDYQTYDGIYIIIAMVSFFLCLYTDFSGYMDIAIGVAQTLGIHLPENFDKPFLSKSIGEFWRRWHMTLGAWLKDYLFYPLLKSGFIVNMGTFLRKRVGKYWGKRIPTYLGLLILWLCVGLWHGAAWTFIAGTGILQWFYIVLGEICQPIFKKIGFNKEKNWFKLFQMCRTFLLMTLSLLFFRAENISSAIKMLISTIKDFQFHLLTSPTKLLIGLELRSYVVLSVSLIILVVVSLLHNKTGVREKLEKLPLVVRWILLYLLIFSTVIFGLYGPGFNASEFIYQGF